MFLKVIACEIAFREICQVAAGSPNLADIEFLNQGYHDTPSKGREEVQRRIDACPPDRYDAILIGYGLCSNILTGLTARHTQLVAPRAHDCIALFLGSKNRYQTMFNERPGTYYYTSGWLECGQRRVAGRPEAKNGYLLSQSGSGMTSMHDHWVQKYGPEKAAYLLEVMKGWTDNYTHGVLIDYEFTKALALDDKVRQICAERNWQFERVAGNLELLDNWLAGRWSNEEFLVVPPGECIAPSYDETILRLGSAGAQAASPPPASSPSSSS